MAVDPQNIPTRNASAQKPAFSSAGILLTLLHLAITAVFSWPMGGITFVAPMALPALMALLAATLAVSVSMGAWRVRVRATESGDDSTLAALYGSQAVALLLAVASVVVAGMLALSGGAGNDFFFPILFSLPFLAWFIGGNHVLQAAGKAKSAFVVMSAISLFHVAIAVAIPQKTISLAWAFLSCWVIGCLVLWIYFNSLNRSAPGLYRLQSKAAVIRAIVREALFVFKRQFLRTLLGVVLLFLGIAIVLSLPVVQTAIGQYVTERINADYKTNIRVEQVAVSVFGGVKLKKVMIRDHHNDTLIYANRIKTNILSFSEAYNGDLFFGDIRLDKMVFKLKTYKGETQSNINTFISLFDDGKKPSGRKFLLKAQNVYFTDSRFLVFDENRANPKDADFSKLDASISNFKIYGPEVSAKINKMAFRDYRGVRVKNLTAKFLYDKTHISLDQLDLETRYSHFKGDVSLKYRQGGMADFNNQVWITAKKMEASVSSNDIRYFYKGISGDKIFDMKSDVSGTLNNLFFRNLHLVDNRNSRINGDVVFKNLFGKEGDAFYMQAAFSKLNSTYDDLAAIMPDVLGKKLPTSLQKLGRFNLNGNVELTPETLVTDFYLSTQIGNIKADLNMSNIDDIDDAVYQGHIIADRFNIGKFIERSDLGIVSFDIDADGSGFTTKNLATKVSGKVSKLYYNRYIYTNIEIDGNLKSPFYKGRAIINDPNLFMDFDGLLDLSGKEKRYDFHTQIDYADLHKLHFIKDTISIFKGDIRMDISGTTVDNMRGKVNIAQASYQNRKDNYIFDDFTLESSFDNQGVRTISINSPDVVDGKVTGKFRFAELGKILQNSAGSLYTNYKPNRVTKGQFLKFNLSIYNKIVEIFYPGIEVGSNTFVRGSINSDESDFKMNFSSPDIKAFDNEFQKVSLNIDNKNPLFNAFIEMDSIKTKYYKVSDFSAINVTMKDTMFVRSEFKGGTKGSDFFNLNLYHTIDKNKNNVVGIKKSELKFKDYLWFLNENSDDGNKIVFDKKLQHFAIDTIMMSHENQKMELMGQLRDSTYKDLSLNFEKVDLSKVLPTVDSLRVTGRLDGKINFKQDKKVFQPTSSLRIDGLNVNDIGLGNMRLNIEGDESFRKFTVNSVLENDNVESFVAEGTFEIANKETQMDVDMRFNRFNIAALSPLGGSVISNIRGFISGTSNISGTFKKPDINGRLFLEEAGLKIPYLNTDYAFRDNSIIDLSENQFIFQNATLVDTKYNTEGRVNGTIKHKNFSDWNLDLAISSDRFLALDTKDSEDAAYYGTAFIDGTATISGPTGDLFIGVDAKSAPGTAIKIPINDTEATSTRNYIHFYSPKEKENIRNGILSTNPDSNYKGLSMKFNLDVNQNADIEVILDRESGHGMNARGVGNLLLEIDTRGKFQMTGDYAVWEGSYNFRYRGLINKTLAVKKNSYITWDGDPLRARLNLEAVYKTDANPAILLDNASVNRKVPVNVGILVTGILSNPEINFDINFPTINAVLKSEIQTKLDDKDIRQTQALTLLATGGFLSNEGVTQSAFTNNLLETGIGIFDNIFQNADDKVNVDLLVVSPDRTPTMETTGQVGFKVSTKVNDRVSVNGQVGVPVGGVNESTIIGNVEVQYRINEDGTANLRFFNRENDINYIGEGIGYTQGVGITYEVDFDTFQQLVNKIFKAKKVETPRKDSDDLPPDSEVLPSYMHINDKKKHDDPAPKPNTEGAPPKED
ncbi:translocation/assembly module TamB domain-containing protein [Flavobacterium magnum]|nr:translocation/assembly module TamB domain-containing protein [Flavobacterium magnum]